MTEAPLVPSGLLGAPERLEALRRTDLLDTPVEEAFERYTRLLSRILGAPVALLSLVDDSRQFFKSSTGLAEPWASGRGTPLSHSFCQHVVDQDAPLRVVDAREDARLQDSAAVHDMGVIAYLGAPVRGPDGQPIGSLCAIDSQPRSWTEEELALLLDLAEVTSELVLMRTAAAERRAAVLDLSHQLRTGLTGLRLELAEVSADLPPGAARAGVEQVSDSLQEQSAALGHALRRLEDSAQGASTTVDLACLLTAVAAEATAHTTTGRLVALDPAAPAAAPALVRSGSELSRVVRGVVDLLLEHGQGTVVLQLLTTPTAVRVRVQDDSRGLPPLVATAVTARSDGGALAEVSLAERTARSLGGRLLLAGSAPTTVDVLLPLPH